MCHSLEMPDIVFWQVNMTCFGQDHLWAPLTYYHNIIQLLNQDDSTCKDSLIPIIPKAVKLRPCGYYDLPRCGRNLNSDADISNGHSLPESEFKKMIKNPIGNETTNSNASQLQSQNTSLDFDLNRALCDSYLKAVYSSEFNPYANVHCAACSGMKIPVDLEVKCSLRHTVSSHLSGGDLLITLDFWGGRFEISSFPSLPGPISELYEGSWKRVRKLRHDFCWAAREDPRLQFVDECQLFKCPNSVPAPSADLPGIILMCSIRRNR